MRILKILRANETFGLDYEKEKMLQRINSFFDLNLSSKNEEQEWAHGLNLKTFIKPVLAKLF
jgi:hypothetical protein